MSAFPRFSRLILAVLMAGVVAGAAASEPAKAPPAPRAGAAMTTTSATSPQVKLEPVAFASIAGWDGDDHLAAFKAFIKSCARLRKAAAGAVAAGKAPPAADLLAACREAAGITKPTRASAKAFFERRFRPHRVVHTGPPGLLTGYYEPLLHGSREATARFKVPVYRRPPDLANVVEESQRGAKANALTHVRLTASGSEPYPTRAEIEQGALAGKGLELIWLEDPVDAFFLHIQGSGRIELPDGSRVRITYDGKNGHPYTSVGRALIDAGLMTAQEMSLQSLGKWLKADAERGRKAMWRNQSFVFFRELSGGEADAAMGSLEIPLTPGRSLAVDTTWHALGTPVWVTSDELGHAAKPASAPAGFHRLMIAQDVGSAIRGPERGDIFFGSGANAGRLAGITKHAGRLVVLLPAADATIASGTQGGPAVDASVPRRQASQ